MASNSNKPVTYDLTTSFEDEESRVVVRSPTMRKAEKRGKLNAPASASPELRRKTSAEPPSDPDNTRVEDSSWLSDEETAAANVIAEAPAWEDSASTVLVTPKEKRKAPMVAPGAPQRKKVKAPSAKPASGSR